MPRIGDDDDSLFSREKAGCSRCLVPDPKKKKNLTGRSEEATIIRIGGIAEMWCARWMRSAFVIPIGNVAKLFLGRIVHHRQIWQAGIAPHKGNRYHEKFDRTDAADSDLSRNRRAQWGKRGEEFAEEKEERAKEALFLCVTFFWNVRCNWTPSKSLHAVKSFTIPAWNRF